MREKFVIAPKEFITSFITEGSYYSLLDELINYGGYPEVIKSEDEEERRIAIKKYREYLSI